MRGNMSKKICFIILYHNMEFNGRTGTDILKNYINNIKSDIGEAYDVDYFLVGDNVNDADYIFKYPDVYENMGYKLNRLGGFRYFYTGRSIYPILDFYKNHTQYDKYFIIEYDTYYTGSFKEFFDNININGDIDIIIPKPEYGVKNWYWYRFGGYVGEDKKTDNIYSYFERQNFVMAHGLLQVYMLSNNAMKYINDIIHYLYNVDYKIVNNIHYEALVPIIILNNKKLINHIGITNPLKFGFFEDIYKEPFYYLDWYDPGKISEYLKKENALLHPVKLHLLHDKIFLENKNRKY